MFLRQLFMMWIASFLLPFKATGQDYFENALHLKVPTAIVNDVIKDSRGFLWMATPNGLMRYDGHQYKSFLQEQADSTSLLSMDIRHIYYDQQNEEIWLSHWGNSKQGVSVFDLGTEKRKVFPAITGKEGSLPGENVFWTFRDKFGRLWVSMKGAGIALFDDKTQKFSVFSYQKKPEEEQLNTRLLNFFEGYAQDVYNDSILWMASAAGLMRFNLITQSFKRYPLTSAPDKHVQILSVYHHIDGKIYLGSWFDGLSSFDPVTEEFHKIDWNYGTYKKEGKFQIIQNICAKDNTHLWVTTGRGLVEYDIEKDQIKRFLSNDEDGRVIYGVRYEDSEGRLYTWENNQISIFDPALQQIRPYYRKTKHPEQFSIFRRFWEDKETGKIWLASQSSEGLYRLDPQTGEWEVFPPGAHYFKGKSSFVAWDVLKTRTGDLLVLEKDTIYQWSETTGQLIPYRLQPNLTGPYYKRMIEDRNGHLWIGSHYSGLIRIDPLSGQIRRYNQELLENTKQEGLGSIWDLKEDRNGNIWIRSNGYHVYHAEKDTFYNFPFFFPDDRVVRHIQSFTTDLDGNVWIVAYESALGITDANFPERGVIHYITPEQGLKSHKPSVAHPDEKGNLWIGSWLLEKMSAKDQSFSIYRNMFFGQYIWGMDRLSDGRMILGFKEMVGIFHPDSIEVYEDNPQPYIISFKLAEQELNTDSSLFTTREVFLQPGEHSFSLQLSALTRSFTRVSDFQYQLQGVDQGWINPGDRRYIGYTNIPPGKYLFQLKAQDSNGDWTDPYQLLIHIPAPWYQTQWAYLLYFVISIIALWQIRNWQNRRRALRAQLAEEQREALRLKELDEVKNRFITNITHEFRTPLTVILGLAKEMAKTPRKKLPERLKLLQQNGLHLLNLINQMLELARLDAQKMTLYPVQDDVIPFLKINTDAYQSLAFSRNIALQFYSETEELLMDFDPEQLQHILQNLIANALKFTPEYGQVLVFAKKLRAEEKDWLEIRVKDDGPGIPPQEIDRIFDRFYQANNQANSSLKGTGLGLALVKELTNLMDGKVWVESKLEKGSTFFVQLPCRNHAPLKKAELQMEKQSILSDGSSNDSDQHWGQGLPLNNRPLLLAIEDNPDLLYYLRECLEEHWQVITASHGEEGYRLATQHVPDVIVSDVMMPGVNGFELCKRLKADERSSHIPILLLTAKATQEDLLEGLANGADAYLVKPFDKHELLLRLDNFLKGRERFRDFMQQPMAEQVPKSKEELFLKRVQDALLAHLEEDDYNSTLLARDLDLSRTQLHRKLKALVGMPTSTYIRDYRLQHAHQLLKTTSLSVSEVAYKTGFSNLSWFSQAYKEKFGHPPSETRK